MISSTLGAPFGGTTRGAHQACDSEAFSLITPPNFGSGGGSCLPSMVVVAPGEPGVPVVWIWAWAEIAVIIATAANITLTRKYLSIFIGYWVGRVGNVILT